MLGKLGSWLGLALLLGVFPGALPAHAQEPSSAPPAGEVSPTPAGVRLRQHFLRVRTSTGFEGAAPGQEFRVSYPLSRDFRLEASFLRGEGTMRSCTHLHHQDVDLGVAWRLDDPDQAGDLPWQRVFLLGQWSASEARIAFAEGDVRVDRDEGFGLGFGRLAHPLEPVSYSWRIVAHPTFANSNGNTMFGQRALLAEGAVQFRLGEDASAEAGYHYRTHKLSSVDGASATEQGPFVGASLRF